MAGSRNSRSNEPVAAAVRAAIERSGAPSSIVVAYSGGLDSSVLLHVAVAVARARSITIRAVHVNHRISPNAFRWEAFCRTVCRNLGVPLAVKRVTVPATTGIGLEAAARIARYRAFEATNGDAILLAHHLDDQAETVLFNLCRGGGPTAAAGMRPRRGRFLRPLLHLERKVLEHYAKEHRLAWIEDESNADPALRRNYLRGEMLPRLERAIPAAGRNLAAAADRFSEACALLDDPARLDLGEESRGFPVSRGRFASLSEPRARNALRYLLEQAHVSIPSDDTLREAVRQLRAAAPDRHPLIHFGPYRLRCSRGVVSVDRTA